MKPLKTGIIGLGEVAQIIHLPILESMPECFEVHALCDISPALLQAVGDKYRVRNLYTNALELAADPELDVVFVLNSDEYHAECTMAALRNGKHVLLEKPMCLTAREADEIIRQRDVSGKQVMIGYMRRYAPAFTEAKQAISGLTRINHVHVRDIIGKNAFFIGQSSRVLSFNDIPEEAAADRRARREAMTDEAIGIDTSDLLRSAFVRLNNLSTHDFSAMRELIGMPRHVTAASLSRDGQFISAIFEYDGFNVVFESGIDDIGRFDGHIQIYSDQQSLLIQYNTPYIRHLPTTLHIEETKDSAYRKTELRPTFKDAYTVELEHFYDVATKGTVPKTSPEDAKQDIELIAMVVQALRARMEEN